MKVFCTLFSFITLEAKCSIIVYPASFGWFSILVFWAEGTCHAASLIIFFPFFSVLLSFQPLSKAEEWKKMKIHGSKSVGKIIFFKNCCCLGGMITSGISTFSENEKKSAEPLKKPWASLK